MKSVQAQQYQEEIDKRDQEIEALKFENNHLAVSFLLILATQRPFGVLLSLNNLTVNLGQTLVRYVRNKTSETRSGHVFHTEETGFTCQCKRKTLLFAGTFAFTDSPPPAPLHLLADPDPNHCNKPGHFSRSKTSIFFSSFCCFAPGCHCNTNNEPDIRLCTAEGVTTSLGGGELGWG